MAKIPKLPGDSFLAVLAFEHKGPAERVDIGVGLAPGRLLGQNPIHAFYYTSIPLEDDPEWTLYQYVSINGFIPTDRPDVTLWDVLAWIQEAGGPRDPGGEGFLETNNWDQDVFEITVAAAFQGLSANYA